MNPRPLYARLAAEVLAEEARLSPEWISEPSPCPSAADVSDTVRMRAIASVSSAMADRQRRLRRMRRGLVVLSMAASVLCVFGAVHAFRALQAPAGTATGSPSTAAIATPLAGDVRVRTGNTVRAISEGTPLGEGDHVLADSTARVSVTLVTGTRLALEGTSDLAMTQGDREMTVFTLGQGAVRADVAKLKTGERFLVRTSDAEVEVRGTSFRVAVTPATPTCGGSTSTTRVEVTEGVVAVRSGSEVLALHPGESWPAPCPRPSASPDPAGAEPPRQPGDGVHDQPSVPRANPVPQRSGIAKGGAQLRSGVAGVAKGETQPRAGVAFGEAQPESPAARERALSDLRAQNDLFAEAMHEKQRGNAKGAIATLERFVATYPASTLVESAVAERMKVLASSDTARARTAAGEYLARYPRGFARGDAEKILATSP